MTPSRRKSAGTSAFATFAELLQGVDRPGSFCVSGQIESPIPDIHVEGVGPLSFPVPEDQAKKLVRVAERAPYGRGGETRVDTRVRRAWQIAKERVRLEDKRWHATVAAIVERVAAGLGAGRGVEAELYKVLLYDAGSFFVEHRDTEKAPGMFATLVIVLPSRHRGGELVVRHGGREACLDLSAEDVSRVSYVAFYADCLHELRPVVEGHRLALVYNLVRKGRDRPPTAPDYSREAERAATWLAGWSGALDRGDEVPGKLLYVLEHHYTPAGLSFEGLKNGDAAVASTLRAAAAQAGCELWLAMVSIRENGIAEESWGRWRDRYDDDHFEVVEVLEHTQTVEGWRSPDGRTMALAALPFVDAELCPAGALADEQPDEQHYHEATGNEGASFERTYRRAALVLWPRRRTMAVLSEAPIAAALPFLRERVEAWARSGASEAAEAWQEDAALARSLLDRWPPPDPSPWSLDDEEHKGAQMLACLRIHRDPSLVDRFLSEVVVAGDYDESENDEIVAAADVVGWRTLGPLVEKLFARHMRRRHAACAGLLLRLAERAPALDASAGKACRALAAAFVAAMPGEDTPEPGELPWRRPDKPDAAFVVTMLRALWKIGDGKLAEAAVDGVLSFGARYPLDEVLLPAVTELAGEHGAGLPALRRGVVDRLDRRIAEPLVEPSDWAQPQRPTCKCSACAELALFLADPARQRWSLRAAEATRKHVQGWLRDERCDMDCTTEKRGSPHTLHCVKNRRSYERRCEQRKGDLAARERLAKARETRVRASPP